MYTTWDEKKDELKKLINEAVEVCNGLVNCETHGYNDMTQKTIENFEYMHIELIKLMHKINKY